MSAHISMKPATI